MIKNKLLISHKDAQKQPANKATDSVFSRNGWGNPTCARPTMVFLSLPLLGGEWPRLPSTARIGRVQFHRARSASKEGTWPLPSSSFRGRALREQRMPQSSIPIFNILLVLENLGFRVRGLRTNLRLRISLIKHQYIPYRHHPDNFACLSHSEMPHA